MKVKFLLGFLCVLVFFTACDNGPIRSSYNPVLPDLPIHWEEHLGRAHWRIEWLDEKMQWREMYLTPAARPLGLSLMQEWSSPVLAWPYWPSRKLLPGMMRPAGAVFPWDVSADKLNLSWSIGVEALLWKELLAAERSSQASQGRLPWYLDWPRFRELLSAGNIPENVRLDPWLPDWKSIAQRTVTSGFDRRRIVSRTFTDLAIPELGGLWIGSSPFAPVINADPEGSLTIKVTSEADTWISAEGLLRASSSGWVFVGN